MEYGMSRLGRVCYRDSNRSVFLATATDERPRTHSEQTAREIDQEVKRILDDSIRKVRHILETRREALEAVTKRLVEVESIDGAELRRIVEECSPGPQIVPGTLDARIRPSPQISDIDADISKPDRGYPDAAV
jgi:cell division protease FtsH